MLSIGLDGTNSLTSFPFFGLCVPIGLSTSALFAVSPASILNSLSIAACFIASARGLQSSGGSSFSSNQYTCSPLPECIIIGLGKPISSTNLPSADSPSFQDG